MGGGDEERTDENEEIGGRITRSIRNLTNNEQRALLRHIPGGNSGMNNMAIMTCPDNWFKRNENVSIHQQEVVHVNNAEEEDECKEFEYQNMNEIESTYE